MWGTMAQASTEQQSVESPVGWTIRRSLYISLLLVVGFVVYSGVDGLLQASSLDVRIAETRSEIVELRTEADQLAALIAWLDSDAYIEQIAREDLGFVRPGEEAFGIRAPTRSSLEFARTPWWDNLLPLDDPSFSSPE